MAKQSKKSEADRWWGFAFCVDGWVTQEEAARQLGVHKNSIRRMCREKKLRRGRKPGMRETVICKRSLNLLLTPVEL